MNYKTIYKKGSAEIVEKKSRFLADVFYIESEEDAFELLEKVKKRYWDARHHCWAYRLGVEQIQERFSDDGEPGGTAGKPILEVIRGSGLHNTLIIVTRYFGGTLLGTGGLVRAYTQAAQAGVSYAEVITKTDGFKMKVETDYTGLGKMQYLLAQHQIPVVDTQYTDVVTFEVLIPVEEEKQFIKILTEATNAKAGIFRQSECCYAVLEGKPVEFD